MAAVSDDQIQDADVAVQIERALDLRQIVGADERLLVHQQRRRPRRRRRDRRGPSGATNASASETPDGHDVHRARDRRATRARRSARESTAGRARDRNRGPGRRTARRSRRPMRRSPAPSSQGSQPPRPPTASQPPTGATAIARPRNSCVHVVHRLASEYQNTIASATGDSSKHSGLERHGARRRTPPTRRRRTATASRRVIAPRGSSRFAVRGLSASKPRVDQPVESHRGAPRRDHRDENPADRRPTCDRRVLRGAAARPPARTAARTPSG